MTDMMDSLKQHKALIGITLAGVLLRLWHINWGLPELYEEATPLTVAWKFWNWGHPGFNFDPNFFNYPALTFYIQFAVQWIHYILGHVLGFYPTPDAFGSTISSVVIPARIVGVLFDAGTIVVGALVAREYYGTRASLIAALLLACNPLLVSESHLIQTDTPLTFFSILSLLFMIKFHREPSMRWYLLAGISTGLAAATKYPGIALVIVLLAAHALRFHTWRELADSFRDKRIGIAVAVSGIIFLLANPFILLNYEGFKRDFAFESYHLSTGHLGIDTSESSIVYYLAGVVPVYLGWLFIIVLPVAIGLMVRRKERINLILFLYPVIYFIMISTWEMRAARYLLPVIPPLMVIGATGIVLMVEWLSSRKGDGTPQYRWAVPLLTGMTILLLIQPIVSTGNYLRKIGLPDTRATVKKWITGHIPHGDAIATGPYGVEFPDSLYRKLEIPFLAVNPEAAAPFYDARWYDEFDCVIASDFDYARYKKEPERFREILPYFNTLGQKWDKLFEAVPSDTQNGPSIWLFRCPDSLRSVRFDSTLFDRLEGEPESTRVSTFLKTLDGILYRKGRVEKSEQVIKEILRVEVDNLPLRNRLASVLFLEGKYTEALRQMQISIQARPDQADIFALAGRSLLRLDKMREAEPTLKRAMSIDPSLLAPYQDLIEIYGKKKDTRSLVQTLRQYRLILPPGSSEAEMVTKRLKELGGK